MFVIMPRCKGSEGQYGNLMPAEIVDQLEAALEEFRGIEEALGVE